MSEVRFLAPGYMTKRKPKTVKVVKEEIKRLKEMKPHIRRLTFFGDDNHVKIEAQIKALEEEMSEDDTYNVWPEDEGSDAVMRSEAQYAIRWRDGEENESPSSGWKPLDQRTN